MTLNFRSYSTFPASIRPDDDFGSIGWGRGTENCGNSCWLDWEKGDERGKDWADPIDLLPADPFGMELGSNLAAAIAGWFEDLGGNSSDCQFYCWNGDYDDDIADGWFSDVFHGASDEEVEDNRLDSIVGTAESLNSREPEKGFPHDGLMLSLGYLGVQDLLSVEQACRSLHSAIQNDPLLWRCIHIDSPLSEKIDDDALLKLTQRAQGSLQCLSLAGCSGITDEGLRKVFESNPMLQKLSVYGCIGLSLDGMLKILKAFKTSGVTGIKRLKLGRLFSLSPKQYEELQTLLCGAEMRRPKPSKPRFYHLGVSSLACDDDCPLDIEMCPRCRNFKLMFDCPSESCQEKGSENCRACEACITRCVQCGRCVNGGFFETFLLDIVCLACWKQAPSG